MYPKSRTDHQHINSCRKTSCTGADADSTVTVMVTGSWQRLLSKAAYNTETLHDKMTLEAYLMERFGPEAPEVPHHVRVFEVGLGVALLGVDEGRKLQTQEQKVG